MLRHELTTSQIRFYNIQTDDPFATYDAICTVVWESPGVIWIKGFHGDLSRRTLRDLLRFLVENKITTIKAHRSLAKSLPGITHRDGTYVELSVADLALKAARSSTETGAP
jgi:hypothetical protein